MGCIKPWPGVKCHGQERVRCCGETGDSHLGVIALAGLMTCSAQSSCGSHRYWWQKSSSELSVLYPFFSSFLLWIGISPWQMILCPNCPKVTPSCEISRAVSVGAEPKVEACILISYGLSSLMRWMVVVGHLTLVFLCSFCQWEETKSPAAAAVMEAAGVSLAGECQTAICGEALWGFFLQAICLEMGARIQNNRSNWG